jgi:hypothetical protein
VPTTELPLFPLNSVLYPGGRLELRIFERRYLDMVRDCARTGAGFGVCLIVRGREVGEPAIPAAFGTSAKIVDFETLPDGLLGITAIGESRFHVDKTRVRDTGLILGTVSMLAPDAVVPVPAEHVLLATILQRLVEQIGGELASASQDKFDDSAWVAYRLAEILPLEPEERQQLLQENDPARRLAMIAEWLPRFQKH